MQLDLLTSSQEGIPASHSVLPGSDEAREMTAISGQNLLALYENFGRAGSLARMLLDTSQWASTKCYLTWKDLNTPGSRLLFRLVPLTPTIDGIDSGLLPAASAQESGPMPELSHKPKKNARNYSKSTGKHCQMTLSRFARLWPTPTTAAHKGSSINAMTRKGGASRLNDRLDYATEQGHIENGRLNPQWVEWLMGYPEGWTELKPSEMPSSRKSQNASSER